MRVERRLVAERTLGFTESVIREMTRLCNRFGGINLAQGFPDFPAPAEIKEAAIAAIRADVNQYAITWGAPSLRRALAEAYRSNYGMDVDPETMLTVTCGATEAMVATLLAIVDPGQEVIVFEPFYENYGPDAALCGARPVYVPLRGPAFTFDRDELAAAFSPRTKAIIVNTPNNPTGRVFDREELSAIAELCVRHDVLAVTDEIYEHIVYEGRHVPIATLPGMVDRTVTISGFSKTFSVTGWRIGTIVAPSALTGAIRKVHDFLTVGAPRAAPGGVRRGITPGTPVLRAPRRRLPRPPRSSVRRSRRGRFPAAAARRRVLPAMRHRALWFRRRCRLRARSRRACGRRRRSGVLILFAARARTRTQPLHLLQAPADARCRGTAARRRAVAARLTPLCSGKPPDRGASAGGPLGRLAARCAKG